MPNFVYIATSLDGYIANRDGSVDWLHDVPDSEGSDLGFADFMSGIDAVVMGRSTFQSVLGFECGWPYPKPVFVLTSTLTVVPEALAGSVEFIAGSPEEVVRDLGNRGLTRLYVDGGKTIQGFLGADLIDELLVSRLPVLLGGGVSLFGGLPASLKFEHVDTEVLLGCIVKSHYRRVR